MPLSTPSSSSSSASSPKHTSVQDEEEPITCTSSPVWQGPSNKTEVPVPLLCNLADVAPVLADDIVPVLADDTDIIPCRSTHALALSTKAAENLGIKQILCIAQAVIESLEAGRCLKGQCAQAKFDWCQHVLDFRMSITNIDAVQTPSLPTNAVPDGTLLPPPTLDPEMDFVAFCEAYATELTSPLIDPCNPDEPTFCKAMNSPDSDKWTRGLYSPPGIPPGIRLESQNSTGLIFDIPAESAQNIMGIVFLLLCLVIPYRVRPDDMG